MNSKKQPKYWVIYSIPYDNDSYYSGAVDEVLTEKPTAEQLAEDYEIHISAAEELLRDGEYHSEDTMYFIQGV